MEDRKSEIIEAAADLLESRSFSGFSYQDLSDRLGIQKASIHHHFKTKEDLGVALSEHYHDAYRTRLEEISRLYANPWDRFEAYLSLSSDIMLTGDKISPGGVLQAENNVIPERVRDGINEMMRYVREWLTGVLSRGKAQRVMAFPGTPEDQATLVIAALQGALQNARAEGPALYQAVVRQLRASVKPAP